jgi:hypothetical protein
MQHRDPTHRKGTGLPTIVQLNEDAEIAWQVWDAIRADHYNDETTVNHDEVKAVIADQSNPKLADLVRIAQDDAQSRPLAGIYQEQANAWAILQALAAKQAELWPLAPIVADSSTECRHGVPFTDDCADCGV